MKELNTYGLINRVSAIVMIVALLLLTISTPFIFRAQQADHQRISASANPFAGAEEDSTNPLSGTEEKAPNTVNLAEEYLHDNERAAGLFDDLSDCHIHGNDGTYVAYHGELLVPPPNQL